jgi:hypothetical protein
MSVDQAKTTIEALPRVTGGYAKYDFMQVGPSPRWASSAPGKIGAGK